MASPGFVVIKSPSASRLVLILPVKGQKVKGIGPGPLEVGFGSREQEPTGSAYRTAIPSGFRHDVDASLQKLQSLCGRDIGAQAHSVSYESINAKLMIITHNLIAIAGSGGKIT